MNPALPAGLPHYAELHCLSNFSFLRAASHAEELVERAKAQGYTALAITDECSLAGVVRAHVAAREADFPLIIGSEFRLADGPRLVLLAVGSTFGYHVVASAAPTEIATVASVMAAVAALAAGRHRPVAMIAGWLSRLTGKASPVTSRKKL